MHYLTINLYTHVNLTVFTNVEKKDESNTVHILESKKKRYDAI